MGRVITPSKSKIVECGDLTEWMEIRSWRLRRERMAAFQHLLVSGVFADSYMMANASCLSKRTGHTLSPQTLTWVVSLTHGEHWIVMAYVPSTDSYAVLSLADIMACNEVMIALFYSVPPVSFISCRSAKSLRYHFSRLEICPTRSSYEPGVLFLGW